MNPLKLRSGEGEAPGRPQLVITVHGQPAPQGSKRHVGHGVMIESSKAVKPWREAVKAAAALDGDGQQYPTGPLYVETTFTLRRPKHHYRTGRNAHLLRDGAPTHPTGYPDGEKLERSTYDALTDIGIWHDDAQIAEAHWRKVYPEGHSDALPHPGAVIRIHPITQAVTG